MIPNGPIASQVRANTMTTSATGAFVMKILRPSKT